MSQENYKKVRSLPRIRLGTSTDKTLSKSTHSLPLKRVANFLRKKHHRTKDDSEVESLSLEHQTWFHGQVTKQYAELAVMKDGDFLVSESPTNSGEYTLTVNHHGARLSYPVCKIHSSKTLKTKYRIDEEVFDTVPELVYFYLDCQVPLSQKLDVFIRHPVNRHTTLLSEDNALGSFYPKNPVEGLESKCRSRLSPTLIRNSSAPSLAFNTIDTGSETLEEAKSRMQSSMASVPPVPNYGEVRKSDELSVKSPTVGFEKSKSCGSLKVHALGDLPQDAATSAPDLHLRTTTPSQRGRNVTSWHGEPNDEDRKRILQIEKSQSGDALDATDRPLPPLPYSKTPANPPPGPVARVPSEEGFEPEHDYEEPKTPTAENSEGVYHFYETPGSPGVQSPTPVAPPLPATSPPSGLRGQTYGTKGPEEDKQKPIEDDSPYQQRKTLGSESRYKLYCQLTDVIRDQLTTVLLKHDVITLARHFTRVDLETTWMDEIGARKSSTKNKEPSSCTLLSIGLPEGEKVREALMKRYRALCLWVGAIVLGTGSLELRQAVLVKLIEIAYVLQSSLGNLLGFMAIMEGLMSPLVVGLQQTWTFIENHHPAIAILYHSKLIPLAQCLNAGVRHPSISHSDICLPYFIPFVKLHTLTQQDILDELDQWSVGYTDVDIDVIFAHLDNVRAFTIQYESFRIEAEKRLRGYKVIPELYEYFSSKVEVHAVIGVKGDHRYVNAKVESLLKWFGEYAEPPQTPANTTV